MSTITVEHLVIALLHNGSTCRGILARWVLCLHLLVCLLCTKPDPRSCAAPGWASVQTPSKPVHTRSCKVIRRQRVPRRKSRYVLLECVVVSHCLCHICQCLIVLLFYVLQTVSSKSTSKSLQEFCRDLCDAAAKNSIDPVSLCR